LPFVVYHKIQNDNRVDLLLKILLRMNMNKQNLLASLNHFVSSKQQQKALQLQLLTLDEHLLK